MPHQLINKFESLYNPPLRSNRHVKFNKQEDTFIDISLPPLCLVLVHIFTLNVFLLACCVFYSN